MSRHTLSVLVEDQPGVLARISALFSRRGFNIDSLAVGPTEIAGISRMTIVVNVEDLPLEQVTKQLNKLVNVLKIVELEPDAAVAARAAPGQGAGRPWSSRSQVLEIAEAVPRQGRRRRHRDGDDRGHRQPRQARGAAQLLEPFGIKELVAVRASSRSAAVPARSPTAACGPADRPA